MANDEAKDEAFTIREPGDVTGEVWAGDFRALKRLSHRLNLLRDAVRRELLGGAPGSPSERAATTAHVLSDLRVRLTKWPAWWESSGFGVDLEDDNIIGILHARALKVEDDAAEAKRKAAEEVQKRLREEAAREAAENASPAPEKK